MQIQIWYAPPVWYSEEFARCFGLAYGTTYMAHLVFEGHGAELARPVDEVGRVLATQLVVGRTEAAVAD